MPFLFHFFQLKFLCLICSILSCLNIYSSNYLMEIVRKIYIYMSMKKNGILQFDIFDLFLFPKLWWKDVISVKNGTAFESIWKLCIYCLLIYIYIYLPHVLISLFLIDVWIILFPFENYRYSYIPVHFNVSIWK